MASEIANISSAWPESEHTQHLVSSQLKIIVPAFLSFLSLLSEWSTWQYAVAFVIGLIVYDQGDYERSFCG